MVLVVVEGGFMKNFSFDPYCKITQKPQELQRFNYVCGFISKSAVADKLL